MEAKRQTDTYMYVINLQVGPGVPPQEGEPGKLRSEEDVQPPLRV